MGHFRSKLAGYETPTGRLGKIWVNPNVPARVGNIKVRKSLRLHEETELKLRKQGVPYKQAHPKALQVEHRGLSANGIARYEGTLGAVARHHPYRR